MAGDGMTEILEKIDETLTFYSAGLGEEVSVPVERDDEALPLILEWTGVSSAGVTWPLESSTADSFRVEASVTFLIAGEPVQFVHYYNLIADERDAIHDWLREHRIVPSQTPIAGAWEYDATTGEWRIPQMHLRNGKAHLGPDGELVTFVARRAERRPLPWRVVEP